MRRLRAILVAAVLGLLLWVGGALAAATILFTRDAGATAAARLGDVLGDTIRYERSRTRALPRPTLILDGVAIGDTTGPGTRLRAAAVELRPSLLALLRGRLVIAQIDVREGALTYSDDGRDVLISATRWTQRLRLSPGLGPDRPARVRLDGRIRVEDLDTSLPRVVFPVRDRRIEIEHRGTLDVGSGDLELDKLGVSVDGVRLDGRGRIEAVASPAARRRAVRLAADDVPADALLRLLAPGPSRRWEAAADGRGRVRLSADGPLTADSIPDIDGTLAFDGVMVDVGGRRLATDLRGEGRLAADSAVLQLGGRFLDDRFTAGAALRNPASPSLVLALGGRAELDRLAAAGLAPASLGLAGSLRTDLQVLYRPRDPAATVLAGSVDVTGLRLAGTDPALAVPYVTVAFQGPRVRIEPVPIRVDGLELVAGMAADGWVAAALDTAAPPPEVVAEVRAADAGLDRFLPRIDALRPRPPPDLRGRFALLAERLTLRGSTYSDAIVDVTLRDTAGVGVFDVEASADSAADRLTAEVESLLERLFGG